MLAICGKKSIHLIYHANLAQQKKQLKISNHHLEFLKLMWPKPNNWNGETHSMNIVGSTGIAWRRLALTNWWNWLIEACLDEIDEAALSYTAHLGRTKGLRPLK